MRIVFMGTPDFAVPSLKILLENNYEVVGVVTASDKVGGRGNKQIIQSAVKRFAVEHNLKVLQPEKLRNPDFIKELADLKADLQIVVAFRMLPEMVWSMPKMGTFNLHGSLLPKYRGAAPINWSIINGDKITGVSTFFLQHDIDTGNILLQKEVPILPEDNVGDLHDRMMEVGAALVLETVKGIENNILIAKPQVDSEVSHAPKLFMSNCEIDFNKSSIEVYNFIRGLSPFPTAWFRFQDLIMKVYAAKYEITSHKLTPGTIRIEKDTFAVATKDGFTYLQDIQLEGRKRMEIHPFLLGFKQ